MDARFTTEFTFGSGSFRVTRINSWLFSVEQLGAYSAHIGTYTTDITDRFSLEHKAMVMLQHAYYKATGELV